LKNHAKESTSRPKKAHLENHLSADELKRRYLDASDPVESIRWHLLWMVCSGWTLKKAAQAIAQSALP